MTNAILLSAGISLLVCVIFTPVLIPILKKLKFGQTIMVEYVKEHAQKNGTPTMGGIAIIAAVLLAVIVCACFFKLDAKIVTLLAGGGFLFGVIGFIDDYAKVANKRNLGLTSSQKFLAQTIVSVVVIVFAVYMGIIDTQILIPFIKTPVNLGIFTIILAVFVQLAVSNSANLTDGLDGLAASVTLNVAGFLTLFAVKLENTAVAVFMAAVCFACVGFLFFNANPAKVFMGDTGSLFLGGCVALGAIMLRMPLALIVVAGVYLIETLSVILQVASFKLRGGKRIFRKTCKINFRNDKYEIFVCFDLQSISVHEPCFV